MKDLPSLRAVRAFEACYRLGSYTRAASALNVRQPAVSHQIRLLETDLGVKLFQKQGTAMVPTEPAHDFYRTVSAALGDIERASARLRRRTEDEGVVLATYPGLASFWVLPRLAVLRTQAPELAVRVTTAELDSHIPLAEVDCAILFGAGHWPGFESRLLIPERVVPVAAPKLSARLAGLKPGELLGAGPLIHLEDPERRWFTWDDWQAAFAPGAERIDKSLSVTNHGIAIHQAIQGNGVALGWSEMIAELLESQVLMPLHEAPLASARGYHFLVSPPFRDTEACRQISQALGVE
ncbi:MAG: LysR substrate-binding domain-containing protein [Pseudomonadota bacterium]